MLLIIRDSVLGSKIVFCPIKKAEEKDEVEIPISHCKEKCNHFDGCKKAENYKLLKCEYYYNQKYNKEE